MMRAWVVAIAVVLSSCQSGAPQDCEVADAEALQCIERYRDKSDREMLEGCYPFSPSERIAGAWVTGFEINEFYEGAQASADLVHKQVGDTALEIESVKKRRPTPTIYQMEFLGRRSLCDMGFPRHVIVVDRVLRRDMKTAR